MGWLYFFSFFFDLFLLGCLGVGLVLQSQNFRGDLYLLALFAPLVCNLLSLFFLVLTLLHCIGNREFFFSFIFGGGCLLWSVGSFDFFCGGFGGGKLLVMLASVNRF